MDSENGVHGVTEAAGGRLFTRQATGLVRGVSPMSTLIFNCFTAPAPFVLAIALFWTLGAFPGANLYVALSQAWSWEIGLAYQYAGNSRSAVQGKSSNLQLDGIMSVNTGLNYAF